MKIDLFRILENNVRSIGGIEEFIKELSNYLEKTNHKDILEKIIKENKVSLISENRMIQEKDKIIKKYVRMASSRPLYKEQAQKRIKQEIIKMANTILSEQNEKLLEHRKEGHLYMLEEDVNERIYLLDLSQKTGMVFEEVDFPQNLKSQATEGAVFKYESGTYSFYSNDGFERLYE